MPPVKCVNCGYLAVRDLYNGAVCEADERARERGKHTSSLNNKATVAGIFCFKNVRVFVPEETDGQANVIQAINREIDCDFFVTWMRGRSAKEHEEMSFAQQAEIRMLANRQEDIRRQQAFEALYEARHQELRKDGEKRHRETIVAARWIAAAGAIAAIAAGIISAIVTVRMTSGN